MRPCTRATAAAAPVKDRLPAALWRAVAVHVGVERGRRDAEPLGHLGRDRRRIAHRRHGHEQRGAVHLARAPAEATAGAGGGQPGMGALGDELTLELGEGGEDAEREAAVGGRRVDLRAGAGRAPSGPTPRVRRSSTVFTRWRRSRPSRSSFQRTSVLPGWSAFRQAARPGRSSRRPEARSW